VDSLMAIEVKNWVEKDFSANITVLDLTSGKNIDELSAKILATTAYQSPTVQTVAKCDFICIHPVTTPSYRLLCLPYLGGSAKTFQNWKANMNPDVEIWAYEPTVISNWSELVESFKRGVQIICPEGDKTPFVIYGHSLGALMAYEISMIIQASPERYPSVKALIVGASGSPSVPVAFTQISAQWDDESLMKIPQEQFMQGLMQAGIVDSTMLGADVLRAQIFLGRRYAGWFASQTSVGAFQGLLTAIYGSKDSISGVDAAQAWKDFSSPSQFNVKEVVGGHLFLHDCATDVIQAIQDGLTH